ncbi:MAG: hypothetical protein JXB48_09090 [Candidatus Latescibacteria bacterium]|nr:hypothetical protein [Candidatus Latescibacterota bacterium]
MKQYIRNIYIILFLIISGGAIYEAATPENVSINITPSTYSVAIGDSLTIFCTISYPDSVVPEEPYFSGDNSSVDISPQWHTSGTSENGNTQEIYGFLTYIFAPDTLQVGPFNVDFTTENGTKSMARSNVLTFIVEGFVDNPEAAPMASRNPFGIKSGGIPLWMIIFFILMIAIVAGILIYRKRKKGIEFEPEVPKPIDEIGEFERIRAMKLYETGHIKELYIQTSSAIRSFIHRNMALDALYETSEEIISHLSRKTRDQKFTQQIRELFEESDMVKFAKFIPPPEQSSTFIDRALLPVKKVLADIEREKARHAMEQESNTGKRKQLVSSKEVD